MKNKYLAIIFFLLTAACGVSLYAYISDSPTLNRHPELVSGSLSGHSPASPSNCHPRAGGDPVTVVTQTPSNHQRLDSRLRGNDSGDRDSGLRRNDNGDKDSRLRGNDSEKQIPVTLKILDRNYETTTAENSTVYELMKKMMDGGQIQFSAKEYSGLGQFVEEINGIKNNKQAGIYWFYYINNQPAGIGISNYYLKSNDIITWKYDKAQF